MAAKAMNDSKYSLLTLIFLGIFLTMSCANLKTVKSIDEASLIRKTPVEKIYKKIVIQKFEVDQDLQKDFPDATVICESTVMNELLKKNTVPKIEKTRLSTTREAAAVIVKTRITVLKLASSSARGLNAAFLGDPEMAANVKLIDAETRRTIREIIISTNKSSTATSSEASSDSSMPYDLGKMIAEYIAENVRGN